MYIVPPHCATVYAHVSWYIMYVGYGLHAPIQSTPNIPHQCVTCCGIIAQLVVLVARNSVQLVALSCATTQQFTQLASVSFC